MERLNDLSREELIHLLMIKTDTITQYDILCAKHTALFEQYRQLCQKHISILRDRRKTYNKGDIDSFKILYRQAEQMKQEIKKICEELRRLECRMKQTASSPACN